MQAAAVAKYGRQMFDRLNSMQFASGGYVGRAITSSTVSNASTVTNSGGNVTDNFNGPITSVDPKAVAREVMQRQRDALLLSRLA